MIINYFYNFDDFDPIYILKIKPAINIKYRFDHYNVIIY